MEEAEPPQQEPGRDQQQDHGDDVAQHVPGARSRAGGLPPGHAMGDGAEPAAQGGQGSSAIPAGAPATSLASHSQGFSTNVADGDEVITTSGLARAPRRTRIKPVPSPIEAILTSKEHIASGVYDLRFTITVPERLGFQAGQFVTLHVPGGELAASVRRSYSIASPTFRGEQVRLIARQIPGGHASEYFTRLSPGAPVTMTGPFGGFILGESHPGDLVFGTTGTGIATIMPMLKELARRPERAPGKRLVYWGLRRAEDIFARDEIEDLCWRAGAELRIHLSSAESGWKGHHGRINDSVLALVPGLCAPMFYLVGNGAMVAEMRSSLVEHGVDRKRQIRTEAFFG